MSRLRVFSRGARVKTLALGSTALSLVLLTGGVALAQTPTPPAAGSLPGAFTTNVAGTTYSTAATTGALPTIAVGTTTATGVVLQWAGTPLGTKVTPSNTPSATNPGFSIGNGATLDITGGTVPVLVNDLSGSISQIYGKLDASGLGGPLYIANPSGILLGSTGTIATPAAGGVGLLAYTVASGTFDGTVSVSDSTNTGVITISQGSSITGPGPVLVAGAAAVNVGLTQGTDIKGQLSIVAGYGFSTAATSVAPTPTTPFSAPNTASVVNFTGGSSTNKITPVALLAGNDVNNSGQLDLSDLVYGVPAVPPAVATPGTIDIVGTLSNAAGGTVTAPTAGGLVAGAINNAGTLNDTAGILTAVGIAPAKGSTTPILTADITNTGTISTIDAATPANSGIKLAITAGSASGVTGNFSSTGTIDLAADAATNTPQDTLTVSAANINLGGKVTPGDTPADALVDLELGAGYATGANAGVAYPNAPATGVVDISANASTTPAATNGIFTGTGEIAGQAVRILAGSGVTATTGALTATIGTGSAIDPFIGNATLGYNFSLFPNSVFAGTGSATTAIVGTQANATSPGSNINLNGVDSSKAAGTAVSVTANNINGTGGFGVADGGTLSLDFSGDVNQPGGRNGSSAYQYNYVPVTVFGGTGSTTAGTGTATVVLSGPTASGQHTPSGVQAQMVNLLVDGSVAIESGIAPLAIPTPPEGEPITPISSYANNHLVVQATGNISLSASNPSVTTGSPTGNVFYWPGLVILNNVASVADPTSVGTGSITLGDPSQSPTTPVILENLLPADTTNVSLGAGGQAGHNGVFFNTNNLVITNGSKVVTSNFSWVNFIDAKTAAEFQSTQGANFLGGFMLAPNLLITQQLPADDFQPKQ